MKLTIPANLDLSYLLSQTKTICLYRRVNGAYVIAPIETKKLIKHLPYCYFLIDLIIKKKLPDQEYTNLLSVEINKYIPSATRLLIVDLLKKLNVIEVNDSYQVGEFSKSYKLTSAYSGYGFKTVDGLGRIVDKASKVSATKTDDLLSNKNYPEYAFQKNCILNIRFDSNGAIQHADELLKSGAVTRTQYDTMILKIDSIEKGEHNISLNNKVNRFFSSITNLNSCLRPFIKDNTGKSLISIDFKSSQTYHLIQTIKNDIHSSHTNKERLGNTLCISFLSEEVESLLEIVQNKGIYEFVQEQYRSEFGESIDRDRAKEIWINHFQYSMYPKRNITKWVKSLFPSIAEYIAVKGRNKISTDLMKSESKLLNAMVIRRISREIPRAIVYSIFDSVLVDEENFDEVYNIILEESANYYGFEPKLKIERFKPVTKQRLPLWYELQQPIIKFNI